MSAFDDAAQVLTLFEQQFGYAEIVAVNPSQYATADAYTPIIEVSFRIPHAPGVFTVRVPAGPSWVAEAVDRLEQGVRDVLAIYLGNRSRADVVPGFEPETIVTGRGVV